MKYIQLTGWGNESNHLVPERSIASFTFSEKYTTVQFASGNTLNVIESKEEVIILLSNLDSKFSTLDQAKYKIDYEAKNNDPHYESTIYGK
tara:strand:- start:449 stop:721 length:273 start_codon:yes stop_codon:yes gene_type:complete